jgi:hypothetical protein
VTPAHVVRFFVLWQTASKSSSSAGELFLGLLCPIEDYKVYGYITNTKIKFICVTEDANMRDSDVKAVRLPPLI